MLHVMILELLLYDSYIFDENDSKLLSEGDYVVKVWGALLETLFRGSGTVLHWGDTVTGNSKATGRTIKMVPNFATGEIAKDIWRSKFYKDKLKTVLSSKMDLHRFVETFQNSHESTLPVYIYYYYGRVRSNSINVISRLQWTLYLKRSCHHLFIKNLI